MAPAAERRTMATRKKELLKMIKEPKYLATLKMTLEKPA